MIAAAPDAKEEDAEVAEDGGRPVGWLALIAPGFVLIGLPLAILLVGARVAARRATRVALQELERAASTGEGPTHRDLVRGRLVVDEAG